MVANGGKKKSAAVAETPLPMRPMLGILILNSTPPFQVRCYYSTVSPASRFLRTDPIRSPRCSLTLTFSGSLARTL